MSATSSPFPVPSGLYPPFAVVTATDHTAWIIITTAIGLSLILQFGIIKITIRWSINPGLDEAVLGVSTILAVIQSAILLAACSVGLGKSIELVVQGNLDKIQQMYYASILLFILSLGLSKISVAFLLLRVTPREAHRRAFYIVAALMAAWTVASMFAVALQCNLSHPWVLFQETCPRVFLRWQLISVFDIGFELALFGMTIYLVWGLQNSETKMTVIFAFSMRLPLIIFIAFRLASFDSTGLTTNPTFLQDKFIVWTQAELCYSLVAATIPSLRPFIQVLATNYGARPANGYGSSYDTGTASGQIPSGNYELGSLRPKGKDEYKYRIWSATTNDGPVKESVTADQSGAKNGADGASLTSNDSQRMIIKKHQTWEVATEL